MKSTSKSNRQLVAVSNPSATASSLLLDQMNLVLSSWKGKPLILSGDTTKNGTRSPPYNNNSSSNISRSLVAVPPAAAVSIPPQTQHEQLNADLERKQWLDDAVDHNVETCRSSLMLYASAAGSFAPNLKAISDYLVDVIQHLSSEVSDRKREMHELQSQARKNQQQPDHAGLAVATLSTTKSASRTLGEVAGVFEDDETKCEYAFSRLDHAKEKMRQMVEESHQIQAKMKEEIDNLTQKLERSETQLEYQIQRMRKSDAGRMDREEFERERSLLECNKQFERERERVKHANAENDELRAKIAALMELNTAFARQAIELGARVRVYADHNERLATHLSLITEEKSSIDRENEMIRAELLDLNRFHQMKDQFDNDKTSKAARTVDLRPVRHGRGANRTRPRHLQFTGLVNRLTLTRPKSCAIVSDILMRRKVSLADPNAVPMDLSTFLRDYMASKHGNIDCIPWCYAIDEACELNDDDANLMMFHCVISNRLSEVAYQDLARDVSVLMGACEVLDEARNGELKLTVSLGDLVGLLVEMFPGYPDSLHKKLLECLMQQLSSTSHVHYRMLFPNLEREEISSTTDGILSQSELRAETAFSSLFKQLFVDDIMITTQQFEDRIFDEATGDRVKWSDIQAAVESTFGRESLAYDEVLAMFRQGMMASFGKESADAASFSVSKVQLMHIVRRKLLLRKAIFRPPSLDGAPKRAKILLSSIGKSSDSALQSIASEVGLSDFRAAINRAPVRRRSFQEEEEKMMAAKARLQLQQQQQQQQQNSQHYSSLQSQQQSPTLLRLSSSARLGSGTDLLSKIESFGGGPAPSSTSTPKS